MEKNVLIEEIGKNFFWKVVVIGLRKFYKMGFHSLTL